MKPYKATYPDGTTAYLTKEEAVTVVANARFSLEPKGMQRCRAEARGLLALFDEEGLDGLYYENVTVTPRHPIFTLAKLRVALTTFAVFAALNGIVKARTDVLVATHALALAAGLLLLRPRRA